MANDADNAQAHQQAPEPNLALKSLDVMVGTWDLKGRESGPDGEIHGRVTFAWMEGGFFVVQRVDIDHIEYVGYDESNEVLKSYFFGNTGPGPFGGELPSSTCGRLATTRSRSGVGSWALRQASRQVQRRPQHRHRPLGVARRRLRGDHDQGQVTTMESNEKIIRANGVDLCVETFGDPADPAILLIHGAATSMLGWEDEFCEHLAAGARFVVRYDHRDTGRSVSYEPGAPRYTLRDLAADAVGLLDAFERDSAHLVGRSMGGGIAMLAALDYPDQVSSLTLVGTSAGGSDLPPMSEEFLAYISGGNPDWSDRVAVIDHVIGLLRVYSGGSGHFDEAAMRDLVGRDIDRTVNIASSQTNHFVMDIGEPIRDRLGDIRAPTLVVHGAEDSVFPLGHALALAKEIPAAHLLALEQTGHELPRAVWDVVVPAILRHTSGG